MVFNTLLFKNALISPSRRGPNTGDLPMKTTNIILTACLAGGLLLGSAGCPGSDKGTQAQRLQSDAGTGLRAGEVPKAAAKSEAGNTVANDGQPELIREARAGDFEGNYPDEYTKLA